MTHATRAVADFDAALADINADDGPVLETKSGAGRATVPAAPAVHAGGTGALTAELQRGNDMLERALARIETRAARGTPSLLPTRAAIHDSKQRLWDELKQTMRDADRTRDPLLHQKSDRLSAELSTREAQENARLRRENAELRLKARRPAGPAGAASPGSYSSKSQVHALHRKASIHYLKTGAETFEGHSLRDLERKALQSQVGPDGGFFIHPEENMGPIERYLSEAVEMRGLATVRPISLASYKTAFNRGGAAASWVGETSSRPETAAPQIDELEFPAMELYANPMATQTIIEDAYLSIEQWIADEVGISFAEAEGTAFISGDGNKKPVGLISAIHTYVANASWAHGKLGYVATGASGAFASSNPWDALLDLQGALKKGYRANSQFLLNRGTLTAVRKIKYGTGDDRYVWEPSGKDGQPATIIGQPYTEVEEMPAIGANSYSIAYGDFKRGYLIVDRIGVSVLRDPYSNKPYISFYTRKRVGGGVQNFEAYKVLKFAAS